MEEEQKRARAEGPRKKGGMKERARYLRQIAQASENCLRGYTFIKTDSLDIFKRKEIEEFIRRHDGRIVSKVSRKVDYIRW